MRKNYFFRIAVEHFLYQKTKITFFMYHAAFALINKKLKNN